MKNKKRTKTLLLEEVQSFTIRVKQLTVHLQKNPKDFSAERGLYQILAKRKRLLKYLNQIQTEIT
jgi:small subunit ribosomal protein S15